jgi:hypothetical protein
MRKPQPSLEVKSFVTLSVRCQIRDVTDEHRSTGRTLIGVIGVTAMAYASERHDWFAGVTNARVAPQACAQNKSGFLRRVAGAVFSWVANFATRADDAEMAALLERSGWRLTDSVEREMLQRRTHSNWNAFY